MGDKIESRRRLLDGRNIYDVEEMNRLGVEYKCIGK